MASRYGGRPIHSMVPAPSFVPPSLDLDMNIYSRPFPEYLGTCTDMMPMSVPMLQEPSSFPEAGVVLMEEGKGLAMELAMSSMDELVKMCHANEPLWIRNIENGKEVLNLEEHGRMFPWPSNLKQNSSETRTEATRDCAVVIMNSITLVDAFLDANKWMELFPSIVARAKTVQVITPGISGASGSLHLLEVLSNGNALHEVAHIANGSHPGNCISLLRINVASNSSQHVELMLQECCTDQSGSLVVYTTVDVESIQLAMSGEDPSCIPLLPLGFVIVPVESSSAVSEGNSIPSNSEDGNGHNNSGCLLTVGLQVLASTIPSAKLNLSSVTAINNHLCTTVNQINAALSNGITAAAAATTTTSSCLDNGNIEPTAPKQV
ncbi:hypothetical protein DKX38_004308 [Salix brachista]|uniref:START domain-containing protein n=1 Tax=Salix brachista TaxID=2182728 RepID=A0A5N5N9U0_9ROSI|nr:hypothetical protein DKX38_004308 [Salix brachista]